MLTGRLRGAVHKGSIQSQLTLINRSRSMKGIKRTTGIFSSILIILLLSSTTFADVPDNKFDLKVVVNVKVLKQALDEVKNINRLDTRVDRYIEIAGKFIEINELDEIDGILSTALWEAHKLYPGKKKVSAFTRLADHYYSIGKKDPAEGLLDQALVLSNHLFSCKDRIKAQLLIARTFADYGKTDRIGGIASSILYNATQLPVSCSKAMMYAEIASTYASINEFDVAKSFLKQAMVLNKAAGSDPDVLHAVALTFADTGDFDTAIQVAETITSDDVKVQTLADISVRMSS